MSHLRRHAVRFALLTCVLLPAGSVVGVPAVAQDYDQTILGPGLYAYQTRVTGATCGDDRQTGYISTFMGTIDGIPGHRQMQMKLINNRYWREWTITVRRGGVVVGESAVPEQEREAHFEVRRRGGRFVGEGSRSYFSTIDGERRRCTVSVDVLLRRFDV
jgi:hypothetical protein